MIGVGVLVCAKKVSSLNLGAEIVGGSGGDFFSQLQLRHPP